MKFLCLHGTGSSSQIFDMQTSALRKELGDKHTYEFVEGSLTRDSGPGMEFLGALNDEFFTYLDESNAQSILTAINQLDRYIEEEGPFDGVIGFSQGAGLAAMLMIRKQKQRAAGATVVDPFKCAIFFSGEVPADPSALEDGRVRFMNHLSDGVIIETPTAHIWGRNDTIYPDFGPVLNELCLEQNKVVFIHDGGHEVPGQKSMDSIMKSVHCIRRLIDLAG